MKFICAKESLLKTLSIAENVIETKTSISILSNIYIEATENKIKIQACDSKINFFSEINADILNQGSISVNCNKFYSIVKKLPCNEIYIDVNNENNINIKPNDNDKISYTLKGIEANKFPVIKENENVKYFSLKQEIFSDMVRKTIFCISTSENRRFVSGIYFEKSENQIKMVGTDGKRLSFIKQNIKIDNNIDKSIIIPPKILNEALKLCTANAEIFIAVSENKIYIKIDNFLFISNLLEGNFPPYEKVIPYNQNIFVTADKQALYESLDRISQISDKESHKINLNINETNMKITSEDIAIGFGEENIKIESNIDNFNIYLNYSFIKDVLNVIKKNKIIFEFKDPKNTVTIREEENNDFIYIMMPMA